MIKNVKIDKEIAAALAKDKKDGKKKKKVLNLEFFCDLCYNKII